MHFCVSEEQHGIVGSFLYRIGIIPLEWWTFSKHFQKVKIYATTPMYILPLNLYNRYESYGYRDLDYNIGHFIDSL